MRERNPELDPSRGERKPRREASEETKRKLGELAFRGDQDTKRKLGERALRGDEGRR